MDLTKIWVALPQQIKDAISQSPTLLIVLLVAYYCFEQLKKEHLGHLKSKDDEIERLVQEKNVLQKEFLKQRLSTADKSKK